MIIIHVCNSSYIKFNKNDSIARPYIMIKIGTYISRYSIPEYFFMRFRIMSSVRTDVMDKIITIPISFKIDYKNINKYIFIKKQ